MTQPGTFQYYFINSSPNFRVQRTKPPTRRPPRFKLNYENTIRPMQKLQIASTFLKSHIGHPYFSKLYIGLQNFQKSYFDPKIFLNYNLTQNLSITFWPLDFFPKFIFIPKTLKIFPKPQDHESAISLILMPIFIKINKWSVFKNYIFIKCLITQI